MTQRKPLIAGNWKMYKTVAEAVETAEALVRRVSTDGNVEVMIAPPFTALALVGRVLQDSGVALGAQNLFYEDEGAFTGEISGPMLRSAGCRYVIIGHSERRQYFGETDATVNRRMVAAIRSGLYPVLCLGESGAERERKETFSVLDKQFEGGLKEIALGDVEHLVIAYEPVWAIGTGKTATSRQAQEAHQFLRSLVERRFGKALAKSIRILYGGSVKPDNIAELMAQPDLDGALVGGASLKADIFSQIVNFPNAG